jgi:hypothetical protein
MTDKRSKEPWHLDKRVNITIIGAVLLQTLVFGVWAGALDAKVNANSNWIRINAPVAERLGRLEEGQSWIKQMVERIDQKLEK